MHKNKSSQSRGTCLKDRINNISFEKQKGADQKFGWLNYYSGKKFQQKYSW